MLVASPSMQIGRCGEIAVEVVCPAVPRAADGIVEMARSVDESHGPVAAEIEKCVDLTPQVSNQDQGLAGKFDRQCVTG